MATQRAGGEPTEQPTPKRLREARERGQVARSQELTAALSFAAGTGVLLWAGSSMWMRLRETTHAGLARAVDSGDRTTKIGPAARDAIEAVATVSLPVVAAAALVAAIAGYLQVGAVFTTRTIAPDLARINPIEGAKRLLSGRTWVELGKSLLKITVVAWLAWDLLSGRFGELARMPGASPQAALLWTASVAGSLLFRVALFYALFGVGNLLWQRYQTRKELMMTRDEVKREHRESEGDPRHKAERQRLHRDLLRHQMVEAVRTADVVIVNPDHIAVALRYDAGTMASPRIVASGERLIAQQIKEVARRYGVPIYRDVPLARSLAALELDDEIPEQLYEAVAAVLRFVYAHRDDAARGGGR